MNRSGWKHGGVAVLIGIVLGLGGLAGQPSAQAAPASSANSEGGYYEGYDQRPCGDCYERERACDDASRRCPDCYDRQPRCGDCAREQQRPCDRCADSTKNRPENRCADSKACEREGERRQDGDDDKDGYKREKKDEEKKDEKEKKERSALHKILRGVFD